MAAARAAVAFCSTTKTPIFRTDSCFTCSKMDATMSGASPSEGSSSSRYWGPAASPRPIATICCWPPDNFQPSASANGRISGKSANIASASRLIAAREALPLEAPSMIFSRAVRPGKMRRPSGTCAMPSRTIASGPSPAMDLPS